ncbi:unnamed protein product [Rotaria magnacalcarata]|uniref:Uncharacterized protein n=1 Tax=Rotaria magnacalcarata TaxID=392030 RepID=A0A816ZPQ0_9BILA|nr:unnamed protein product [Rotaria magnacalcarata]CAF1445165.1 unnamed protein product [Rotaria magnacalcarata]CAF1954355.1 unnamed protein product [Rotaria magnacalcarata]CAF2122530.1 unnamed protein product [Rotaria magnacalcarata]CAF2218447.1 unnamed protein product [Rotaria magnacalcarata]
MHSTSTVHNNHSMNSTNTAHIINTTKPHTVHANTTTKAHTAHINTTTEAHTIHTTTTATTASCSCQCQCPKGAIQPQVQGATVQYQYIPAPHQHIGR